MRLVAIASPTPPLFDRAASSQLLVQVIFRGTGVGIVFVVIRRVLAKSRLGSDQGFGVLLVLFVVVSALFTPWRAEFRQGPLFLGLLLFAIVAGVFGYATAWLTARIEQWLASRGNGPVQVIVVGAVAALGSVAGILGLLSIAIKDLVSGS